MKNMKSKASKLVMGMLMSVAAVTANAATDTIFTTAVNKVTVILSGTGGILITLIAIIAAVVAGATGNLKTALTALGVAVLANVGPAVANSFFTAVM